MYADVSSEKMKDSVTAESGNYSNSGLSINPHGPSINPHGPALRNMTSHCGESQNGRLSETDLD